MSEASGNLFRRAALSQLCLDILPRPGVQECARSHGAGGSPHTPAPSSVTTGPEPGLGSGSYDLCHSSAYNYDDLGRLSQVIGGQGTVATYNFDVVGNLGRRSKDRGAMAPPS